jgi:hypothetical protein
MPPSIVKTDELRALAERSGFRLRLSCGFRDLPCSAHTEAETLTPPVVYDSAHLHVPKPIESPGVPNPRRAFRAPSTISECQHVEMENVYSRFVASRWRTGPLFPMPPFWATRSGSVCPNSRQAGKTAGVGLLALICAEHTRQAGRFQSSSAPRVLLSPRGRQREIKRRRALAQNYAERLRAGSSPALVF